MLLLQLRLMTYPNGDDVLGVRNLSSGSGMEAEESQLLHGDDSKDLKP